MSSSSDQQTKGNTRLYRAVCLFLALICLVLLLVVIFLSVKREYLQPWICFHATTNHCWRDYVSNTRAECERIVVFHQQCRNKRKYMSEFHCFILFLGQTMKTKHVHMFCLRHYSFPSHSSHFALISSPNWIHCLPGERGGYKSKQAQPLIYSNLQLRAVPGSLPHCWSQMWVWCQVGKGHAGNLVQAKDTPRSKSNTFVFFIILFLETVLLSQLRGPRRKLVHVLVFREPRTCFWNFDQDSADFNQLYCFLLMCNGHVLTCAYKNNIYTKKQKC